MPVSIKDVALEAGVSKSTVSAVVNNLSCVRPETKAKVDHAIEKLGYRPNLAARELITQKKSNIGIVNVVYDVSLENFKSYFDTMSETTYFDIATAVMADLSKTQYGLMIERVGFSQRSLALPAFARRGSVTGVFLIGTIFSDAYVENLLRHIEHVVVIGNRCGVADCVVNDYTRSAQAATEYLIARNHRRIAYINGDPESSASPDKLLGYKTALAQAGIPFHEALADQARFTGKDGYEAFARLWNRCEEKPTAAFFSSDELAAGAARFLHERGIRVPQDISLMGYEDSALAEFMTPPLTTVRRNKHLLGHEACRLMLSRIKQPDQPPRLCVVPFSIGERGSVRMLEQ